MGKGRLIMKNMIILFVAILFSSRLAVPCHAAITDDMDAIMNANASPAASNELHARWVFQTTGTSVKVYMFARKTGHATSTLNIQVGAGAVNAFQSTNSYGQSITIGCTPNQNVQISIRINAATVVTSDNWDATEYGHFKVLNFPGFDIKSGASTMTIPPGLWLGMEDSPNHTGVTFDYNDFCVVIVGCTASFRARVPKANEPLVPTPPATITWDNNGRTTRLTTMVNGILSRSAEDKY
jgi:hypothetical protein